MARLVAKPACAGHLPVARGEMTLTEHMPAAITSVKPLKGQDQAVAAAVKDEIGVAWPAIGRATGRAEARLVWAGLGEVLVLGSAVSPEGAMVADQSDAWAVLSLQGPSAAEVLARLTPLDLRDGAFKRGHAARSLLGHMTCLFLRTGSERYEMLVFRSMATTAIHELTQAMESVAAQESRL